MDKQYRTRDGRKVRIYAVDGSSNLPIHGAIKFDNGWKSSCWNPNGLHFTGCSNLNDLIEVKPRIQREYWVNVPPEGNLSPVCWLTKERLMAFQATTASPALKSP
jgi:hypothetical protein